MNKINSFTFSLIIVFSSFLNAEIAVKRPAKSYQVNQALDPLLTKRLPEASRTEALSAAQKLKSILSQNALNIVTAESLTAGMIAKTMADVPGEGAVIYGGFVVYDTDAKRKFIDVKTKGVYSEKTAQQMAMGALKNSRAMVGLAVTGDAMPFPDDKEELGILYIGVALRLKDEIKVFSKRLNLCEKKEIAPVCDAWKTLTASGDQPKYAPFQFTSLIADYLRNRTVSEACLEASFLISQALAKGWLWETLPHESYDQSCEPSWIIQKRTEQPNFGPKCQGKDTNSI